MTDISSRGYSRESTTLIVTVLNEVSTIDPLLESVAEQSVPPDEIVIVDGGSTDGTLEKLRTWSARMRLRVISCPGANISTGRNKAIHASIGNVIAVTDAGVRLDPDWLSRLHVKLTADVDVVGGFFSADPRSTFERALGATTLPAADEVRPEGFLPSSRSVLFRRAAWEAAGGYPEWLDYCEDLVFDLALKRGGCRFAFAPEAVAWFRPRRTLVAFFRQYYLYARGDGKAGLWPRRHAIRYATYITAAVLLFKHTPFTWLLPIGVLAYAWRPFQRLPWTGSLGDRVLAVALVPLIRLVGDVAKMLGYPVGVGWRLCRA